MRERESGLELMMMYHTRKIKQRAELLLFWANSLREKKDVYDTHITETRERERESERESKNPQHQPVHVFHISSNNISNIEGSKFEFFTRFSPSKILTSTTNTERHELLLPCCGSSVRFFIFYLRQSTYFDKIANTIQFEWSLLPSTAHLLKKDEQRERERERVPFRVFRYDSSPLSLLTI